MPIKGVRTICLAGTLAALSSVGCAQPLAESLLAQAKQTYHTEFEQVLDNVAMFKVRPDGLPEYLRISRGSVEVRPENHWSVGTDTYFQGGPRRGMVLEVTALSDPGDLLRVRLLFQWVTGRIDFEQFETHWREIRDQPEFGPDGKQVFESRGRPTLYSAPIPITKDSSRDWFTTDPSLAADVQRHGSFGGVKVWVKDVEGAAMFVIAAIRSMPNTKPPHAVPYPGR